MVGADRGFPRRSKLASEHQAAARASILDFLDASPDVYSVVFTANTSAALKLVGEAYPFSPSTVLVLQCDCHNAVNGVRAFAKKAGSPVEYIGRDVLRPLSAHDIAVRPRVPPRTSWLTRFASSLSLPGVDQVS